MTENESSVFSSVDAVLTASEALSTTCVIDPDTRQITIPSEYNLFGISSDEKVNRIYFRCPRIVGDNIDLTELNLYINYRNGNNQLNAYLIEDVTVDEDDIIFSWLLSRHVTAYAGTVSFIVCAKKTDGENITNEWNTRIASGTVGEGLETVQEIEEQNSDIIEQILLKMTNVNNKLSHYPKDIVSVKSLPEFPEDDVLYLVVDEL